MKFQRIDDTIAVCAKHLDDVGARGTQIENFLVGYALIVIGAEYEKCLKALYLARIAKSADSHVSHAAAHALSRYAARYEIKDITHNLEHFGDDYCDAFKAKTKDPANALVVVGHSSLCSNRNSVAHGSGSLLTLVELTQFSAEGHKIFDFVAESLNLTAAEAASITW